MGVSYDEGYVHKVEPLGKVDKRDLTWIGVIQSRHHRNAQIRKDRCPKLSDDHLAHNYWRGEASKRPLWEWVAKEAKVIEVDSTLSRVRPNSSLLDMVTCKPPAK